jgi:hypothetical protein
MATNKKSFILYCDLIHTVEKMPDEKAGQLLKHVLRYVNDLNPQTDDLIVSLTFEPIKQQLKRDLQQWDKIREVRSDAGKASAEARKRNKEQQMLTNVEFAEQKPTNLTVTDNVTVTVTDNVTKNKKVGFQPNFDELESWMVEPLKIWYAYKKEKKQNYLEIGWNSLVKKMKASFTNENDLMKAIENTMANNWQGIVVPTANHKTTTDPMHDDLTQMDYSKPF